MGSREALMEDLKEALELELRESYRWVPDGDTEEQLDRELSKRMATPRAELSEQLDISIKALYDKAVQSAQETLNAVKPIDDQNIDDFCALHDISLALQHWEDDISRSQSDEKSNPLLNIEHAGSNFAYLARTLRMSLNSIIKNQEDLRQHFSQLRHLKSPSRSDLISSLHSQVSALRDTISPLRTLSDRNRGVGLAAKISQKVEQSRKMLQQKKPSESIYQRAVKSHFDVASRDFIPEGVVKEFINPSRRDDLVAELRVEKSEQGQELVDYIIEKAAFLFAISAGVGFGVDKLILAMQSFRENEIDDNYLPFLTADELKSKGLKGDRYVLLEELDYEFWEGPRASSFRSIQWQFCVPLFAAGKICNDLHQQAILPFIERGTELKHGGFGEVFKVKIHERHIQDPSHLLDTLPEYYAVKLIKPSDPKKKALGQFWTKEAGNLENMMERKVENVVRFITAFRRENESEREASNWNHYIVCEWADGGSVHDVWKRKPLPLLGPKLVSEVTFQLLGLAEALVAAHYPEGGRTLIRHGDLKPENILCFLGGGDDVVGTLKIGDWGLAKQKNNPTALQNQPSSLPGDTVRYTAPETLTGILIDGKIRRDRKSRLQDTWAMGCIILEFIMWMLYGLKHLNDFHAKIDDSKHRAYWEEDLSKGLSADTKEARVARIVEHQMELIAKDPRCGTDPEANAIAALLGLVRTRLLVVPLPKGLGHIDMIPDDDDDDSELLRPNRHPSVPIRRSTIMGDEETDVETVDSDARSLAPSTGHASLDVEEGTQGRPEAQSQEAETVSGEAREHLLPEIPVVVIEEHRETSAEGRDLLHTSVDLQQPDTVHSRVDLTTRARSTELREMLSEIVKKGVGSDSYWATGQIPKGQTPTTQAILAGKGLPGDIPTAVNTDSGYGTGSSGNAPLQSSDGPSVTYSSSIPVVGSSRSSEGQSSGGFLAPQKERNLDYTFPVLDKDWNFHVDNAFAARVFSAIKDRSLLGFPDITSSREEVKLCKDCEVLRVWEPGFSIQYGTDELKSRAPSCMLCEMFWNVCVNRKATELPTARFVKEESWLKLNGTGPPVLSLLRDPYMNGPSNLRLGLPVRPASGSAAHFEIMRQWLQTCQNSHSHPPPPLSILPTRLLEVGQEGSEDIFLREKSDPYFMEDKYVALSHPWGKPPHFCTFRSNIASHKQGITLDSLPPVFRDAVIATRALGIRYLWIDSICIVQGPEGDFQAEARRMEQVFSTAVCVLAASSASGQSESWLGSTYVDTSQTSFVSLRYSPSRTDTASTRSVYITPNIDNFAADVLESPLNGRGWVLQERALARRTIYFTKTQTYFECGDGVRCSTMTKMTNSLAMLLGDTAFPQVMMSASKGERILRYQDFYRNYSRLGLTRAYDRPVAIAGLQSRLLKAFRTEGGFGIFDEGPALRGHLGRSLLWVRGEDVEALEEISFPVPFGGTALFSAAGEKDTALMSQHRHQPPPSWSWMAYSGGIDYLDLEFDGIDWEEGISTPWNQPGWGVRPTMSAMFVLDDGTRSSRAVLSAMARDFNFKFEVPQSDGADRISTVEIVNNSGAAAGVGRNQKGRIIFDNPWHARACISEGDRIKCVVLGRTSWSSLSRSREGGAGSRIAYVVVIAPWSFKTGSPQAAADEEIKRSMETDNGERMFWKRIGAGHLPSWSISGAAPILVEII